MDSRSQVEEANSCKYSLDYTLYQSHTNMHKSDVYVFTIVTLIIIIKYLILDLVISGLEQPKKELARPILLRFDHIHKILYCLIPFHKINFTSLFKYVIKYMYQHNAL